MAIVIMWLCFCVIFLQEKNITPPVFLLVCYIVTFVRFCLIDSLLVFDFGLNVYVMLFFVGSAITGPIGKECADLWPRIASAANAIV